MALTPSLDKCVSPVRLRQFDGFYSLYPCGHCINCLSRRQSLWRRKLSLELQTEGVYARFITLTYSNAHLPLLEYDSENRFISFTRTKFHRDGTPFRSIEKPFFADKSYDYKDYFASVVIDFPHFVSYRHNDTIRFDDSNTLAVSYLPDVQDFVKRLRTNLSRAPELAGEDLSFKYFICSEYGPQTFRPHYHGILFFKSKAVSDFADSHFIFKTWGKCDFNENKFDELSKPITSQGGVSAYVSKYITSVSDLPLCLRAPFSRPFYTFSKSNPIGSEFVCNNVTRAYPHVQNSSLMAQALVHDGNLLYDRTFFDEKSREFITTRSPYPCSLWYRVFPRFAFYGYLPSDFFLKVFRYLYSFAKYNIPYSSERKRLISEYDIIDPLYNPYGKHTFGRLLPTILSRPDAVHMYCFGIPQNYSASVKIICNFRNLLYTDYHTYLNDYRRFESVQFSQSFEQFSEYLNTQRLSYSFKDPCFVLYCYPSLNETLPPTLDGLAALDSSTYSKLERILTYGFGLHITDFYSDGNKISPFHDDFAFNEYYQYNVYRYYKHKNTVKYKHNKFEDK